MPRIEGTQIGVTPSGSPVYTPLIIVTFEFASARGDGPAIVDSGADITIVPAEVLLAAGIDFDSLPAGSTGQGAGGSFVSRPCQGRIRFRQWAICDNFLVAAPGALPQVLLGRQDFFMKFDVRFHWHKTPPTFDIDPVA